MAEAVFICESVDALDASAPKTYTCFVCNASFHRRSSGDSDGRKCCSRSCGFEWQAFARGASRPASYTVEHPRCRRCGKAFTTAKHEVYCSASCRAPAIVARVSTCGVCSQAFHVRKGKQGRYCDPCRPVVLAAARERAKTVAIATGKKAAARKARKIKVRGVAVEAVNLVAVLERDRWTCQLCGIKTPKKLRGTYDDRAPEVDHIIPIAEGGEHSYRNTQCACRKCNIAKSGTARGQLRLFG